MAQKILIVDDEPNIVLSLEFLLSEAGYETITARDGGEALALAEAVRPDLVVLDVMLPVVDGFEICRRVRDGRGTQRMKILMLIARGRENEMKKGIAAGADAYMTKPFATKELVETVTGLLRPRA
jgi:DNA-binding response OmpR family regulator